MLKVEKGSIFYHATGSLLEKDSIVLQGSYGEILLKRYGKFDKIASGNPIRYFYEQELEAYRKLHYASKPSRFSCIFLCHTRENFNLFLKHDQRAYQFGYKVEIMDEVLDYHIADWEKYDTSWVERLDWANGFYDSVKMYWDSKFDSITLNGKLEILVNSRVRILERIY